MNANTPYRRKPDLTCVNRRDRYQAAWILWFGAYGDTHLLVYANSLDDALDECVDWIADNAPGLLADKEVEDEYQRLTEGVDPQDEDAIDKAMCDAAVDTTRAGNCGNYLNSWEWGITLENATPKEISDFAHGR